MMVFFQTRLGKSVSPTLKHSLKKIEFSFSTFYCLNLTTLCAHKMFKHTLKLICCKIFNLYLPILRLLGVIMLKYSYQNICGALRTDKKNELNQDILFNIIIERNISSRKQVKNLVLCKDLTKNK